MNKGQCLIIGNILLIIFSVNLPSVNELSQMFPKLDGDLGCVTNHFRFDHLVPAENTLENADSIELKTPLQNARQFVAVAPDEEDDEPTLSTDYSAIQSELRPAFQQTSEGVISTATKLLEEVINKSTPKHQTQSLAGSAAGSPKHTSTLSSNPQMQKQTSLHGSESASSVCSLRTICDRTPRRHLEYSRFMSVDQRSISDTEDNVAIECSPMRTRGGPKTQSCANIKLSCQALRSPGVILVKEKYIELPKQVAQRTNSVGIVENLDKSKSVASSTESVTKLPKNGPNKPRFTTTKVDESQLGTSVLKEV